LNAFMAGHRTRKGGFLGRYLNRSSGLGIVNGTGLSRGGE
jgi:hypothetical protein